MAFTNRIIVKTDASTREDKGCGLAYKASIYDQFGVEETHTNSSFISNKLKSTNAEALAVLFALKNIRRRFKTIRNDYIKNFLLVIETDCKQTTGRIKKNHHYHKIDKFIHHYLCFFNETRSRWIPREVNEDVDAMAKNMFRKGIERQA